MAVITCPERLLVGDTLVIKADDVPYGTEFQMRVVVAGGASLNQHNINGREIEIETTSFAPGDYNIAVQMVKGAFVDTIGTAQLEVIALTAGADFRSQAQRTLDAINDTLEGKASTDQQSISLNGKSIARYAPEELLKMRDYYSELVAKEKRQAQSKTGFKTVKAYF